MSYFALAFRGALGLVAAWGAVPALAVPVTINNGAQFTTTNGGRIDAHGGGVIKVGIYYYLLGENRNPDYSFRAVSLYRSTDLKSWEFRKDILKSSSAAELNRANIERPKLIYNDRTRKYVLWAHKENAENYYEARVAVAVSDTIDGDYAYQGSFRPLDNESRDMTIFKDTDGVAYLVSSARVNADLNIYRLNDDYTGVQSLVKVLYGFTREAPAVVKKDGRYFILTSGATGWNPNQAAYFTATNLAGPWSGPTSFGDDVTYNSQSTFILPIQGSAGTSYLYLGDRWGPAVGQIVNDSTYVWLPLTFPTSTSMALGTASQITIDTAAGTIALGSPQTTLVNVRSNSSSRCLNVADDRVNYDARVIQWDCFNTARNERVERRNSGGYTQYVVQHSGLCLAAENNTANGAALIQTACSIGTRSQWTYNGTTIVNRASGGCMDVADGSTANGSRIITWQCNGGNNQKWTMVP